MSVTYLVPSMRGPYIPDKFIATKQIKGLSNFFVPAKQFILFSSLEFIYLFFILRKILVLIFAHTVCFSIQPKRNHTWTSQLCIFEGRKTKRELLLSPTPHLFIPFKVRKVQNTIKEIISSNHPPPHPHILSPISSLTFIIPIHIFISISKLILLLLLSPLSVTVTVVVTIEGTVLVC